MRFERHQQPVLGGPVAKRREAFGGAGPQIAGDGTHRDGVPGPDRVGQREGELFPARPVGVAKLGWIVPAQQGLDLDEPHARTG